MPYFCRKLGKMSQNLSSSTVVIGALRVRLIDFSQNDRRLKKYSHTIYVISSDHLQAFEIHVGSFADATDFSCVQGTFVRFTSAFFKPMCLEEAAQTHFASDAIFYY